MSWSVWAGLSKIDMPHGHVNHGCAHADRQMHRAGIARQHYLAFFQECRELMHVGLSDHVAEFTGATGCSVGGHSYGDIGGVIRCSSEHKDTGSLPTQCRHGLAKIFRSPGFLGFARADLHRDQRQTERAIGCDARACPLLCLTGSCETDGLMRTKTAAPKRKEIGHIEAVESAKVMHADAIRQPWILQDRDSTGGDSAPCVRRADHCGEQPAPTGEGEVDDTVVADRGEGVGPCCDVGREWLGAL